MTQVFVLVLVLCISSASELPCVLILCECSGPNSVSDFLQRPSVSTDLFIQLLLQDGGGLLGSKLSQGSGVAALLALLAVQTQGSLHVMDVCAAQLQLPSQVIDLLDQRHVLLKQSELDR